MEKIRYSDSSAIVQDNGNRVILRKKLTYLDPWRLVQHLSRMEKSAGADISQIIFLDSSANDEYGRYSFVMFNPLCTYTAPITIADNSVSSTCATAIDAARNEVPSSTAIHALMAEWQALLNHNKTENDTDLPPFTGGLAGYLSYDLGKRFEHIPAHLDPVVPDYHLGLYNQVFAFDHVNSLTYAIVHPVVGYEIDYAAQLKQMLTIYNAAKEWVPDLIQDDNPIVRDDKVVARWQPNITPNFTHDEYIDLVRKAKEYIRDGDIYEVNLAQCFSGVLPESYAANELYGRLRKINPAPFAVYLNVGEITILSASPERFLFVCGNKIQARPIKGTIKRSIEPMEDLQFAQTLQSSEKERAENIMIVDLLRNDLGKICTPGSIQVTKLCGVESFANLHHLVSVIEGELRPDVTLFDMLHATFPGGSITGAPKIRAMQIIEELERVRRGVYCGSIGYFGFNGNIDLSVAIRTMVVRDAASAGGSDSQRHLSFYAGGAITLDSDPEAEYQETLLKAEKLRAAL